MGPVVKMIMDHPRCAQLQEGDVLMEVNGENVRSYAHNELVTVLKRCPKGNQATFVVLRQPNEVRQLVALMCVVSTSLSERTSSTNDVLIGSCKHSAEFRMLIIKCVYTERLLGDNLFVIIAGAAANLPWSRRLQ